MLPVSQLMSTLRHPDQHDLQLYLPVSMLASKKDNTQARLLYIQMTHAESESIACILVLE